jgi:two-component system cell cycle sensor histidine kinase/response regulator CckA
MKSTDWKISRRLVFRTTLPLIVVILVMAVSLYVFNLRLISSFARGQIEVSLESLSHEIYQICDRNFNQLLEEGLLEDSKSVRISKANTLGLIEDFLRNNHLNGQILDQNDAPLFPVTIPPKLLIQSFSQQQPSGISEILYGYKDYFLTRTRFKPWGWQIFIFKDAFAFANLISEVRKVYLRTGVLLLVAAILLLYNLNKAVKNPVTKIIDDLSLGKNPEYRGIIEFEYLSDNIRQMMIALKESEQTIRNITAGLGEGVYVINTAGCLVFMNPEAERLLGWQESELLGQNVHKIFHQHRPDPGLLPRDECPILQILKSGEAYRTEDDFFSRKDGDLFPVSYVATPLRENEEIIGAVTAFQDVSERKQAEEALRESQQRLAEIFDFLPDATFAIDLERKVIAWNRAIEEMTGVKSTAVLGKGDYEYALPFYGSRRPVLIDLVFASDAEIEKQYIFVRKQGDILLAETEVPLGSGEIRILWAKARPLYNYEGKIIGAIEAIRDVTQRKQAEDELRKLNRTLTMLSACNESVIRAKDEASLLQEVCRIIVEVGGYFMAWVGLGEEDEGRTVRPVAFAGHEDGYLQAVKISWADNEWGQGPTGRAIRTGKPAFAENISSDPAYSPWRDEAARRHYGASLSIPLTISERTVGALNLFLAQPGAFAAEEVKLLVELGGDLAYGLEALRNREERQKIEEAFENLVRSAPMGIFIASESKFKLVNPGFLTITGYDEQELLEQDPLALVAPEFAEKARENTVKMLKGERLTPFEFQFIDKNGEKRWVMETLTQTQYRGERVVLGYFMEITEKKQLEKQLLQAQKMEAVGRLAGGLAHDFSNLLAVIIWSVQRMMSEFDQTHPMYQHLEGIKLSTDQAILLTRQLLAFSRKQMVQPRVVNLNGVISEMENMMRRLIGEDVELTVVLDPNLKAVKADPARVEQVIMNLVVNARDAMLWGGSLTIETRNVTLDLSYAQTHFEVKPGPYVLLAVSDTGMGMDPETQSHIFEPFYTTKEVDKGTGLGLSIVYGIVKQSGGNIAVRSELGLGTTFKIYLPQVEEEMKPVKVRAIPVAQLHGSETILLVEDENLVRNLIAATLKKYGYTVLSAGQGNEALSKAEEHPGPIHLMLTDVVMPQMSGRELAERLAASRPEVKVLFMSGYTEKAVFHGKVLDKDALFIEKPFTPLDLLGKVREMLDAASEK